MLDVEDFIEAIENNKMKVLLIALILLGVFVGSAYASYYTLITVYKPAIAKIEFVDLTVPITKVKTHFNRNLTYEKVEITIENIYDFNLNVTVFLDLYDFDDTLVAQGYKTDIIPPSQAKTFNIILNYLQNATLYDIKYAILTINAN